MVQGGLFNDLPSFTVPLGQDELRLLAELPDYDSHQSVRAVSGKDELVARRLARRGLVKLHQWKDDPISIRATVYAGRLISPVRSAGGAGKA